jgi:hypothetical protein
MAMTGPFVNHGIRITAVVALLLAAMPSPIRPPGPSHPAPPPNHLPPNFAILEFGHRGQLAMSARPSMREADALQSGIKDELDADIEDDLTVTSPPAFVPFDVLPSPCPERYSELPSFALAVARPLRC